MPTSEATVLASTTVLVLTADSLACMLLFVKASLKVFEALFSFAIFFSAGGGIFLSPRQGLHRCYRR